MAEPDLENISVWHTHRGRALPASAVRLLAYRVLTDEKVRWDYVGIVLARREQIHAMNREHLGHDYPTDVLSFPITEAPERLQGEVYIDLDTAAENAAEYKTSFSQEVGLYVIHGLLHLIGYDDAASDSRKRMKHLEGIYLQRYWGPAG